MLYMECSLFQGKLPVSGMCVTSLEDNETQSNALEITG